MTIRYTHHVTDAMLTELATDIKALYSMKEIVNYVYNGKPLPPKYEKIIEQKDGYIRELEEICAGMQDHSKEI